MTETRRLHVWAKWSHHFFRSWPIRWRPFPRQRTMPPHRLRGRGAKWTPEDEDRLLAWRIRRIERALPGVYGSLTQPFVHRNDR